MPIRINLLAEAQAAEELRRKDPVKRAMLMGACCIALIALVSVVLQSQVISTNSSLKGYSERISAISNDYADVVQNTEKLRKVNLHMRGLNILSSERLLYGTLMNALQKIYVDDVQLIHLKTEHSYALTEPAKDKKDPKKVSKPATASEQVMIVLEARDTGNPPGDQVNKFKEAVSQNAYFQSLLGKDSELRLVNLSPPQLSQDTGRPVVQFTLEARPPEKVRLGINSADRYASSKSDAKTATRPSGPVKL